jgi:hypothetical protein
MLVASLLDVVRDQQHVGATSPHRLRHQLQSTPLKFEEPEIFYTGYTAVDERLIRATNAVVLEPQWSLRTRLNASRASDGAAARSVPRHRFQPTPLIRTHSILWSRATPDQLLYSALYGAATTTIVHFDRPLRDVEEADEQAWRAWLVQDQPDHLSIACASQAELRVPQVADSSQRAGFVRFSSQMQEEL